MKAKDIMTTSVITAAPDQTIGEIAAFMCKRRISGLPVVENEEVIGVVSEGDLLRRHEIGSDERPASWWLRLLGSNSSPGDYIKSRSRRVSDVMTVGAVTVDEDTPLSEIARLFETRHIKRVPVLRDEKLVGLVSRANLVRALAAASQETVTPTAVSDEAVREALLAELESQPWWSGSDASVIVSNGTVHLWGTYHNTDEQKAVRVTAENIAGVKKVEDHREQYMPQYITLGD